MPSERDEWSRMKNVNPHYVIAGIICVIGAALILSIALSFIGLPVLIIGIAYFAFARWSQSKERPHYSDRS